MTSIPPLLASGTSGTAELPTSFYSASVRMRTPKRLVATVILVVLAAALGCALVVDYFNGASITIIVALKGLGFLVVALFAGVCLDGLIRNVVMTSRIDEAGIHTNNKHWAWDQIESVGWVPPVVQKGYSLRFKAIRSNVNGLLLYDRVVTELECRHIMAMLYQFVSPRYPHVLIDQNFPSK